MVRIKKKGMLHGGITSSVRKRVARCDTEKVLQPIRKDAISVSQKMQLGTKAVRWPQG